MVFKVKGLGQIIEGVSVDRECSIIKYDSFQNLEMGKNSKEDRGEDIERGGKVGVWCLGDKEEE